MVSGVGGESRQHCQCVHGICFALGLFFSKMLHSRLKEYSSLQDNQYNVRYIHIVLIVHNYFAPRGVVNVVISESSYCSAHALGHTHINDITGPAAGLAWADKVCV